MSDPLIQMEKLIRSLPPERRERLVDLLRPEPEPLAIIGLGCRFPGGADDPASFWDLLRGGVDAVSEVPGDRWDPAAFHDLDPAAKGKGNVRWGGFLRSVAEFDPAYFGIAPREAARMDPQQRLMLEVAVEALEDAGQPLDQLAGTQTGVFIGVSSDDYGLLQLADPTLIDTYTATGVIRSVVANRLSYLLDLKGPSLSIDTACSSSLVALHLATRSLRSKECDLALVGASSLILSPHFAVAVSKLQALSADGKCKTFDARADGFVRGEGCGVVVLKRLSSALAGKDPIRALIRGSAVNQDGHTHGLTAPNGPSQQIVIRRALRDGAVKPDQVSFIEAHGTGTPLGDPIEVNALAEVYGKPYPGAHPCAIGSVKTNIGHLEAAAGIAGLIKIVLSLENETIPPHLHFRVPNPDITMEGTRLFIPTEAHRFARGDARRFGALSSFGIGGTNAHVVLEEAPARPPQIVERERPRHLMALSAKSPEALAALAGRFAAYLSAAAPDALPDACFTANVARSHFDHRLAVEAGSPTEMGDRLAAFAAGRDVAAVSSGVIDPGRPPEVVLLFTGQGSQYAGMGRELYATQPIFRAALDRCDEVLRPVLGQSLLSVIHPAEDAPSQIEETAFTQPALFALEYALSELWRSLGVVPAAVIGHSVGEYVAACVAGVLSVEDGLRLVAERGRLMQELRGDGEMAAIFATDAEVVAAITPHRDVVSIAAHNGPTEWVISGERGAVRAILEDFTRRGIRTRRLAVSHAFHSPLMAPMLDAFERAAARVSYAAPRITLISNVTGEAADAALVGNASYWRRHVLAPVRFHEGIQALYREGHRVFLEVGPSPILIGLGQRSVPEGPGTWLPSLHKGKSDWSTLLQSLGALYARGVNPTFAGIEEGYPRKRVHAPTYPFQRRRLWIEVDSRAHAPRPPAVERSPLGVLGRRLRSPLLDAVVFESRFSGDALPLLSEHRIYGRIVVPGACYLAMALLAGTRILGAMPLILRDVIFHRPLVLSDNESRTVQLILSGSPDAAAPMSFRVVSADDTDDAAWVEHASGVLAADVVDDGAPLDPRSLESTRARVGGAQRADDFFYRPSATLGLDLGPSFRWMAEIHPGDREVLCHMVDPDHGEPADACPLPTGLADACLQALASSLPAREREASLYVPIGVDKLRWRGPLASRGLCHARLRSSTADREEPGDSFTGDVLVLDETGLPSITIEGAHLRRAPRDALLRDAREDVLFEVAWRSAPPAKRQKGPPSGTPSRWLILAGEGGIGAALAARLEARGDRCVVVTLGDSGARPASREDFERAVADAARAGHEPLRGVLYDLGARGAVTRDAWTTAALERCSGVLYLVQALVAAGQAATLWILTAGAQPVGLGAMADPWSVAQAPLWGMGRVLASELPELGCKLLDRDPASTREDAAAQIADEIGAPDQEDQIAHRAGVRYVPRLVPHRASVAPGGPLRLRADGRYLITGGLGGLGLRVARWMVARGARHLILMGRGAMSPLAAETVSALRSADATVDVVQGDVARPGEINRILETGGAARLPLRGVVHAAGVIDDGVLLRQDATRLAAVMAPKVDGGANLHAETLDQPLDFFVLFSSAASIMGPEGQGTYAAANAFLDALAHHRRAAGLPALSVSWGPWAEVGMAQASKPHERGGFIARGFDPIDPDDGAELLEKMLARGAAHVAALPIRWSTYAPELAEGRVPELFAARVREAGPLLAPQPEARGAESALARMVGEAAPASRLAVVAAHVQELVSRVMGLDTVAPLAPRARFFEAGMDSLMALELYRQLQVSLGPARRLPSTIVFDHPTTEALAGHVLEELERALSLSAPQGAARPAQEEDAPTKLDRLSQPQVEAILDEKLAAIEALLDRG